MIQVFALYAQGDFALPLQLGSRNTMFSYKVGSVTLYNQDLTGSPSNPGQMQIRIVIISADAWRRFSVLRLRQKNGAKRLL